MLFSQQAHLTPVCELRQPQFSLPFPPVPTACVPPAFTMIQYHPIGSGVKQIFFGAIMFFPQGILPKAEKLEEQLVTSNLNRPPNKVPQVELLRCLAVGGVFLFHAWSTMPEMSRTGPLGYVLAEASSWGHLGVVVFNILSGFVLSLPYLGENQLPTPEYIKFLRRRFLRIVPHYWMALFFWTLILLVSSASSASLVWPFLAHMFFFHTFFPGIFFSIVPAYWWLGLLAQFYLAFPVLLKLFRRWGGLRCLVGISLFSWGGWLALHTAASGEPGGWLASLDYLLYFNLPARLPEFAAGMWLASSRLATLKLKPIGDCSPLSSSSFSGRSLVLAGLLLVPAGFLVDPEQLPLYHPYLSMWCFLLVSWILGSHWAASLGRLAPVAGLGMISYSVYLMHQPVLAYVALLMEKTGLGSAHWLFFLAGSLCVTAALSIGLEKLLRLAPKRSSRKLG